MAQNYEFDEETLQCPLCNEFLSPPIHQCRNGHTVCAPCCEKLVGKECPFCRATPFAHSRNLAVEKIVEALRIKCEHFSEGCIEMMKLSEKAEHATSCEYRSLQCPLPECMHTGPKRGIPKHFKSIHSIVTVQVHPETRSVKFSMLLAKKWQYVLVTAGNELLLVQAYCTADQVYSVEIEDLRQLQESEDFLEFQHTVSIFGCSSFGSEPLKYKLKVSMKYGPDDDHNDVEEDMLTFSYKTVTVNNQMNENVWEGRNYVFLPALIPGDEVEMKLSLV